MSRISVLVNYLKINSSYRVILKNIYPFIMGKIGLNPKSIVISTENHLVLLKNGQTKNGHM